MFYSIYKIDNSINRIWISSGFAIFAYWLFMYSRRIRAECTSLSEIYSINSNSNKHEDLINSIGRSPFPTGAFPLVAKKSGTIFISNMHKSDWSKDSATELYKQFTKLNNLFIKQNKQVTKMKYEVFLDRSTIPYGDLWRRHLLRGISECSYFVAILDDKCLLVDDQCLKSGWVLTESIYAALLRKNVAKPIILLVFKSQESMTKIKDSSYGKLYKDIFEIPEHLQMGAGILITNNKEPSLEMVIKTLEKIKPMQLL